jgi:SAM-dependent methyltransferase
VYPGFSAINHRVHQPLPAAKEICRCPSRSKAPNIETLESGEYRLRTEIELDDLGPVREHYASEGVVARVLTALRKVNGAEVPITPDTLAPIDHFHG